MRLLLVEDNARLAGFIAQGLMTAGFTVDTVGLADEALAALATTRYDACVLDLGLPDADGLSVLKSLRGRREQTPVLILTARDGVANRITGLNLGADDYVLKPFALEELVARVKALLRRPGAALGVILELGDVTLDTASRAVAVAGKPVVLSRLELMLLEELLRRAGRVVARSIIEDSLHGFSDSVTANSLEALVSRLRKKLVAAGASIEIHTVRGVGYLATEGRLA
ncbi:MAG TPA: response regulator transcription factor [Dongiaceae bacterium]|jgi:DNA-binding response OmpR family regulator|nr:response regulator transcription factor [Dongiaceae bacterium]